MSFTRPSSAVACPPSVAGYCGGRATEDGEAGIYNNLKILDPRLRGDDTNAPNLTFYYLNLAPDVVVRRRKPCV